MDSSVSDPARCPRCKVRMRVYDSRPKRGKRLRRMRCLQCGLRTSSVEVLSVTWKSVVGLALRVDKFPTTRSADALTPHEPSAYSTVTEARK